MEIVAPSFAAVDPAVPVLRLWSSEYRFSKNSTISTISNCYTSRKKIDRSCVKIRASNSPKQDGNSTLNNSNDFDFQEDLSYLLKLGAGSVAGAAVIKYGSIILPEITIPNIVQALIMIFAPVIVAVVLLVNQSRAKW